MTYGQKCLLPWFTCTLKERVTFIKMMLKIDAGSGGHRGHMGQGYLLIVFFFFNYYRYRKICLLYIMKKYIKHIKNI